MGRTPWIRPINSVLHKGETIGGNLPAARTASPPLRGLSLAEEPFTRAVERTSSCVDHARRPMSPTELPPANPPLSEPRDLQKSPSRVGWNEPAPAWTTHGGKSPDHGAVMHGPPRFDGNHERRSGAKVAQ